MDPITVAIVAALTAGATSGLTETAKSAFVDAYNALKSLLKNKFGNESEVIKAVEGLETKPQSPNRQGMLKEELADVKADQDAELLQAAQMLLSQIRAQPGGEEHIQIATGSYIAQSDRGGISTVNVDHLKSN